MLIRIGLVMVFLGTMMGDSEIMTLPVALIGLGMFMVIVGTRLEAWRHE